MTIFLSRNTLKSFYVIRTNSSSAPSSSSVIVCMRFTSEIFIPDFVEKGCIRQCFLRAKSLLQNNSHGEFVEVLSL